MDTIRPITIGATMPDYYPRSLPDVAAMYRVPRLLIDKSKPGHYSSACRDAEQFICKVEGFTETVRRS